MLQAGLHGVGPTECGYRKWKSGASQRFLSLVFDATFNVTIKAKKVRQVSSVEHINETIRAMQLRQLSSADHISYEYHH